MTDLELTKLCADAMGGVVTHELPRGHKGAGWIRLDGKIFSPLKDDVQAMALLKRFPIDCLNAMCREGSADFNRTICEAVANMQKSKG